MLHLLSPGHAGSFDATVHGLVRGRACGYAACVVAVSVAAPQCGMEGISVYGLGGWSCTLLLRCLVATTLLRTWCSAM